VKEKWLTCSFKLELQLRYEGPGWLPVKEKWLTCACTLELQLRKTRRPDSCMLIESQCKCSPLGALLMLYLDEGLGFSPVKEKWLACACLQVGH
jgi:hypothetical protein